MTFLNTWTKFHLVLCDDGQEIWKIGIHIASQSHRTYSGVLISRVPLFLGVFFKKASTACGNWPRQTLIVINLIGQCKVSISLHTPPLNMALYKLFSISC